MSDPDPLSGVSVFVTAARMGSFTRAAERLGITKSAVGKSIGRLESRLGFKLFHRTGRLTRLTADGEAYLQACAAAIDEISAAEAALSSQNRVLTGRIHIDMPVAFGRKVLMPILLEIARPHPDLHLTLTFTDATSDLFQDDIDLAVRFGALKDSSSLIARHLVQQERVICAAPAYILANGEPLTLSDVRSHRCIVGSPKGPPTVWHVREAGSEKRFTPPATHSLSDGEAMVDAAVGGLGLCQLPMSLVRHRLDEGLLVRVLENCPSVPVDVHAVWPHQAQLSPRVRYVVDELVAYAARGMLS